MATTIASIASIGVPREIKPDERRVALTPDAVRELVSHGLQVRIEQGAGEGAGISDAAFEAAGAALVDQTEAWAAHLVVKVKEPQPEEFAFLRADLVLLTYLHLAPYPAVGRALLQAGTTARRVKCSERAAVTCGDCACNRKAETRSFAVHRAA